MISKKPYSRSERVGKQILDIISSTAVRKIDLSSLGFVTFTKVDISPDLKNAKIFYSVINKKVSDQEVDIALNKKQKAFKKFLGPELNLRSIPKIKFINDQFSLYQKKIDRLLNGLNKSEKSDDFKSQ